MKYGFGIMYMDILLCTEKKKNLQETMNTKSFEEDCALTITSRSFKDWIVIGFRSKSMGVSEKCSRNVLALITKIRIDAEKIQYSITAYLRVRFGRIQSYKTTSRYNRLVCVYYHY